MDEVAEQHARQAAEAAALDAQKAKEEKAARKARKRAAKAAAAAEAAAAEEEAQQNAFLAQMEDLEMDLDVATPVTTGLDDEDLMDRDGLASALNAVDLGSSAAQRREEAEAVADTLGGVESKLQRESDARRAKAQARRDAETAAEAAEAAAARGAADEAGSAERKGKERDLVSQLRDALGGNDSAFSQFKKASKSFRKGKITAAAYVDYFFESFGDQAPALSKRLIEVVPGEEKQSELAHALRANEKVIFILFDHMTEYSINFI